MKVGFTVRLTVTENLFLDPVTAATETWLLLNPFFLASSTARSVASLREPAGDAFVPSIWSGMKTTPARAPAAAARSHAAL